MLMEHDLFGKPVSTFPDHALDGGSVCRTYSLEFIASAGPRVILQARAASASSPPPALRWGGSAQRASAMSRGGGHIGCARPPTPDPSPPRAARVGGRGKAVR